MHVSQGSPFCQTYCIGLSSFLMYVENYFMKLTHLKGYLV